MKPKVIVFTTAYHPFIGGAEIAIQEIAGRLKDRFDFYIVTARFRRDLPKKEVRPEGVVIRVGFGRSFDKWFLPIFGFIKCATLGVAHPGAVLWGVDISTGSFAAALLKLFHPRIHFIFNLQYGYGDDRLARGRLGLIGFALRFILSQADFVTAISSYLLDTARSYGYKGPAEVVPNGVDMEKFQAPSSKFPLNSKPQTSNFKTIITTSRLVPKNGIDTLIRAMAEVKKKMTDIQCWILGEGPEKVSYQLLVTSNKLENTVKLLGAVPHEKIPGYLHQADLFVRPSRSEGMGNSFVEALAAGIPIVGTPVGGITDIIEDGKTGLFARVDDPQDLAEKITRLLNDRNLAELIVRNGQKMVEERFSWDKIAEKYVQTFIQLVKHRVSNILIATPLFPPQIGGPALYAKNLEEEFEKFGCEVRTAAFTGFLRYPSGLRHLLYFLTLVWRASRSDLIFALDYTSVGFPAAVASFLLRKPLVIRVEGDFLWESFVQRTRKDITLSRFYQIPQPLTRKERLVKKISGWVMRRATRLVFSSEWRRSMVLKAYSIPEKKTAIIRNVWPAVSYQLSVTSNRHIILWAGRMLYLKNLYRLIRAFRRVNDGSWELHLVGDGPERKRLEEFITAENVRGVRILPPLSRENLVKKMRESAFFVLPSLSEVGPNVIADAVAACLPFILTEESGYAEYLKDVGFLVRPSNEEELKEGMRKLMREDERRKYQERVRRVSLKRSWVEAAEEWLTLFSSARDTQSQAI